MFYFKLFLKLFVRLLDILIIYMTLSNENTQKNIFETFKTYDKRLLDIHIKM